MSRNPLVVYAVYAQIQIRGKQGWSRNVAPSRQEAISRAERGPSSKTFEGNVSLSAYEQCELLICVEQFQIQAFPCNQRAGLFTGCGSESNYSHEGQNRRRPAQESARKAANGANAKRRRGAFRSCQIAFTMHDE
jgi:hypothetical protein